MTRSTQAGLLTLRSSVTVTLLIILQRGQQIASSSCRLFAFSQEMVKLLYSNSFLLQLSHLFACMECLRKITLACTCMTCAKAEGSRICRKWPSVMVTHGRRSHRYLIALYWSIHRFSSRIASSPSAAMATRSSAVCASSSARVSPAPVPGFEDTAPLRVATDRRTAPD